MKPRPARRRAAPCQGVVEVDRECRHQSRLSLQPTRQGSSAPVVCRHSGIKSTLRSSRIVFADNAIKASCAPSEAGARNTLVALPEQKPLPRRGLRLRPPLVSRGEVHGGPILRGGNRKWQG